jgi:sulfofructose kinase
MMAGGLPPSSQPEWDVVGVGAVCMDHVCRMPVFPRPGCDTSKVRLRAESRLCGGQTATALVTCARFGLRAKFVGAIGRDEDGKRILSELATRGVDVTDVAVLDQATATATILIDDHGERLVLWHRDERLCVPVDRLPMDAITHARVVHVDDVDIEAAIAAASAARRAGARVTCDIDHVTPRTAALLEFVTDPVFAEQVPLDLTGRADQGDALRTLWDRYGVPVVVTLGERGALGFDGDTMMPVPALSVHVVDTTGAGDVFRAGFVFGLRHAWAANNRIRFANAAAAVSCTRLGSMSSAPSLDEVHALMGTGPHVWPIGGGPRRQEES